MFGATPGIYDNPLAAYIVSKGYEVEENNKWLVVKKVVDGRTYYRPCRKSDISVAIEEKWLKIIITKDQALKELDKK